MRPYRRISSCPRRTVLSLAGSGLLASLFPLRGGATQSQASVFLDANRAVVRRVFEDVINDGTMATIGDLYGPVLLDPVHAERHSPRPAGLPVPIEDFHMVFPGIVATIETMVAEGDLVATRVTWQQASSLVGAIIRGRTMHLSRVVHGRIVEEWSVGWDWLDSDLDQLFPLHKALPGV